MSLTGFEFLNLTFQELSIVNPYDRDYSDSKGFHLQRSFLSQRIPADLCFPVEAYSRNGQIPHHCLGHRACIIEGEVKPFYVLQLRTLLVKHLPQRALMSIFPRLPCFCDAWGPFLSSIVEVKFCVEAEEGVWFCGGEWFLFITDIKTQPFAWESAASDIMSGWINIRVGEGWFASSVLDRRLLLEVPAETSGW